MSDNAFTPSAVAVKPGEAVTWRYPSGAGSNNHNVHFDDGSFEAPLEPASAPWMATRTFSATEAETTFSYHCHLHGGPGGVGMSGIVYINATGTVPARAPTASFTVSPSPARVGESVAFNAMSSTGPENAIIRYEWDLDGDGSYEIDTGTSSSTSRSYNTAGSRTVRLRVTDNRGLVDTTTRPLTVTIAPTASFTVLPNPAQAGQPVTYDGSASGDPDGTIARYEWDLDGNGSFEKITGTTATTSSTYSNPATLTIGLRVTDDVGVTTLTTRSLQISAAQPAPTVTPTAEPSPTNTPAGKPAAPTRGPVSCDSIEDAQRTRCMQKSCMSLKGGKRASCIRKTCRYVNRGQRAACIRKSCRFVGRRRRAGCALKGCRLLKGLKRRACLRDHRRRD